MRAVVAGEQDHGPLRESQLVDLRNHSADLLVHVGDHVLEVPLPILALTRRTSWCRQEGTVNLYQRHVGKKRPIPVRLDEVGHRPGDDVRPVIVRPERSVGAVDVQQRFPETGSEPVDLPQARLIETGFLRPRPLPTEAWLVVLGSQQLPLAGHRSPVAAFLHVLADRLLAAVEDREGRVVADVREAGHQLDPTGSAQRLRVTVAKSQALPGKPVNVRRLVLPAAVAPEALVADIVGHNQDHVGAS